MLDLLKNIALNLLTIKLKGLDMKHLSIKEKERSKCYKNLFMKPDLSKLYFKSKRKLNQFLLFNGSLGCCISLFLSAILIEIGIGSIAALIIYGPMILLGLKLFGFTILLTEVGFKLSLILFVLFCLSLSPATLSFLRIPLL